MLVAKLINTDKYHLEDDVLFHGDTPFSGSIKQEKEGFIFKQNFSNGKLHGIQKVYYKSGELKEVSIYTAGRENGRRIEYFPCGGKKMNANFVNGVQDGICEEWEQNGMIKSRKTYYKGKLIAVMANP